MANQIYKSENVFIYLFYSTYFSGMLSSLNETANLVKNAEPVSAHPEKIQEQQVRFLSVIADVLLCCQCVGKSW